MGKKREEQRCNNSFSAISAVICNILTSMHLMSQHCDFWLQHWSSDSQASSFAPKADMLFWTKISNSKIE